ncbi:MAG TPA: NUDIX hydrolase [Patescibacteria group bacterium]|nr:NUDIX hydrolase [Patescibacteria group bacterium]
MKKWKILSSSVALDSKWFHVKKDIVELPNGRIVEDFYLWESPDVVLTVPVTQDNKLIMVKQYKHGAGKIIIEFPAGYINNDEAAVDAAKRELEEETGYEANEIELLKTMIHHPTKETGSYSIYLARVEKEKIKPQNFDGNEEIEVIEVPVHEVLDMIHDGRIYAAGSIAAAYLALDKLEYLKEDFK